MSRRTQMQGTLDYLWESAPGVPTEYLERKRQHGVTLRDRFANRLKDLTSWLGRPSFEGEAERYPKAAAVACWYRDGKTLARVLERAARSGPAILLWCVSDAEMATLTESARTRADRVASADFDQ